MQRRDLCKLSPLILASAAGYGAHGQSPQPFPGEGLFNVRSYGATGDGKTVDTPAINRAIEAIAAAGGGTLLFPAGTYVCFTIRLRSHVSLFFQAAAPSLPPTLPSPTKPPATTEASMILPARHNRGNSIRIMATITGPIRCSTGRTSETFQFLDQA